LNTTVRDPATGKDLKVVLDGGALIDWLRNQNYAVPTLRAAPDRIDGLAAVRPDAIEAIALDRVTRAPPPGPGVPALGYGLALGVSCRESYPFATPEDLAAVDTRGYRQLGVFQQDCRDVWKVAAAPEAMHRPVASSLPTLLISGTFDTRWLLKTGGASGQYYVRASGHHSKWNSPKVAVPGPGRTLGTASAGPRWEIG
jgi:hypothetical protein